MKIAIIGAGFAGLSAGKILTEFGHDCTIFEKVFDIGGVWSSSRHYPGLRTQNNKDTYCFSDFPMPASYPEWPSCVQVQQYLENYARTFNLIGFIHLNSEVISADPLDAGGWELSVRNVESEALAKYRFDKLIVANGIFSVPAIPPYKGQREFQEAGGRLVATSDIHSLDEVRDKNVLVVGYGKSACDAAAAIGEVAASNTVIARELIWKMPRKIMNVLNYKYLMLTRLGEGLFPYIERRGVEKFLHDGAGKKLRDSMINSLQSIVIRQYKLDMLGLVPRGSFEKIARSTVSLVTDELFDQVRKGRTEIIRDCEISYLAQENGKPVAVLIDGRTVPADVVVCGTGFHQVTPFFSEEIHKELKDENGNFLLYRQVLPVGVPDLYFSGYNSSFYSPLSAEIAALFIAAHLMGQFALPSKHEMLGEVRKRLRWMEERSEGHHASGTNIIPFSLHNIDEMLDTMGLNVSKMTRFKQWLVPIDAKDYRIVTRRLLARQEALGHRQLSNLNSDIFSSSD